MNTLKVTPINVVELIIPPPAFDFPRPAKENVIHIGPLVDLERDCLISDKGYLRVTEEIKRVKQSKTTKRLFLSMLRWVPSHR